MTRLERAPMAVKSLELGFQSHTYPKVWREPICLDEG
jgi:hypothetical protein